MMTPKVYTPDECRAIRHRFGCTQEQMAQLVGLSQSSAWRNYEMGRRRCRGPIARLLEVLEALPKAAWPHFLTR